MDDRFWHSIADCKLNYKLSLAKKMKDKYLEQHPSLWFSSENEN